jgi:hypothetical protein
MSSRRIIIICALCLAGSTVVALPTRGQDGPKAKDEKPTEQPKLEDLDRSWTAAHARFLTATAEVLSLKRQVEDGDRQLAPLLEKVRRMEAEPKSLPHDYELTRAHQELRTLSDKLEYERKRSDLVTAETVERDAWEKAVEAGWAYVPQLFDMYGRIMDLPGREQQARPHWERAESVLEALGKLEKYLPPPAQPQKPVKPAKPENEQARRAIIRTLRRQATEYDDMVHRIMDQLSRLREQQDGLKGYRSLAKPNPTDYATGGRVQNMLDTIEARIKDLDQRRDAFLDLAKTYRQWADEFENERPK